MTYSQAVLASKIERNENLKAHFDLSNIESIVSGLTENQIVFISDIIDSKHYFKLNGILTNLGFKQYEKPNTTF